VLYFAVIEVPLLNGLQFTTTAFLASQAGIFLGLVAWERRARLPSVTAAGLCCAAALLFIGAIIRFESLAMALLVAAPVMVLLVYDASRPSLVPLGITAIATGAAITMAIAYDSRYYDHDPQWRGFRSYNQLRGKFHDECWTFYAPETAHVFASAGWSANDHTMIANCFSDDPELYSAAKLEQIVAAYPWKQARQRTKYWRLTFREIVHNRSVLAVMFLLPFTLYVVRGSGPKWAFLGSAAMAVFLVAFVAWNKKMPPQRVYFPLLTFPMSVALLAPAWPTKTRDRHGTDPTGRAIVAWLTRPPRQVRPLLAYGMTVLLVVGVGMAIHRQYRRSVHVRRARGELQAFLADLRPTGRQVYVCWRCAMPFELISPFDSLRSWAHMPLLAMGWPQRTPYQERIKQQFDIASIARAIFEREDVVLVVAPEDCSSIGAFAKEHFDAEIEFRALKQSGERLVAGHFHRCKGSETVAAAQFGTKAQ
jgi:hypothetical protein